MGLGTATPPRGVPSRVNDAGFMHCHVRGVLQLTDAVSNS